MNPTKKYLNQKATVWVSGFVLVGGLVIAGMLGFLSLQSVESTGSSLATPNADNFHYTDPHAPKTVQQ